MQKSYETHFAAWRAEDVRDIGKRDHDRPCPPAIIIDTFEDLKAISMHVETRILQK